MCIRDRSGSQLLTRMIKSFCAPVTANELDAHFSEVMHIMFSGMLTLNSISVVAHSSGSEISTFVQK